MASGRHVAGVRCAGPAYLIWRHAGECCRRGSASCVRLNCDCCHCLLELRRRQVCPSDLEAVLRWVHGRRSGRRIERAFSAAVSAQMEPIRLEVTRTQHNDLSRQDGVPEGLRMYRGGPVVIGSEFRWSPRNHGHRGCCWRCSAVTTAWSRHSPVVALLPFASSQHVLQTGLPPVSGRNRTCTNRRHRGHSGGGPPPIPATERIRSLG